MTLGDTRNRQVRDQAIKICDFIFYIRLINRSVTLGQGPIFVTNRQLYENHINICCGYMILYRHVG